MVKILPANASDTATFIHSQALLPMWHAADTQQCDDAETAMTCKLPCWMQSKSVVDADAKHCM